MPTPSGAEPEPGSSGRRWAPLLAALAAVATGFGAVAVFIAEQDEPAKLWNLGVLVIASAVMVLTLWLVPKRRTGGRFDHRFTGAVAAICVMVLGAVTNPFYASSAPPPVPPQVSPQVSPSSPAPSSPTGDVRMHEIWPSSAQNDPHTMEEGGWAATDFPVQAPYIRSVEVAAGSEGNGKVQLSVYDEHQQELASGEAEVRDWRAKYTFEKPVDVRAHLGKRLFLVVRNLWPEKVRVYFTEFDADPSVTSYLPCANKRLAQCPNPQARDLSAMVVGRW
ncbi:hypothetical protein [Actinoplanes sp. CA-252034]|uniref:hypothetical protein n=1 Tax=Actinoplanes sp. CA-252034 TaxID=3239906 RepID=UPI003D95F6E8